MKKLIISRVIAKYSDKRLSMDKVLKKVHWNGALDADSFIQVDCDECGATADLWTHAQRGRHLILCKKCLNIANEAEE